MRTIKCLGLGLMIWSASARDAAAQMLAWEDRGYVMVNVGVQPQAEEFTATSTPVIYDENASISIPHTISSGVFFDLTVGARVWRNLGIGVGYARLADDDMPTITAQIPNPLFVAAPRAATASAGELKHSDSVIHLQFLWMLPVSDRFEIAAFAGPSRYTVEQDMLGALTDSNLTEGAVPFGTVTISSVPRAIQKRVKGGYNLGVDGTYLITPRWGAGGFVRFSSAAVDFPVSGGSRVSVDVGGLQLGGGLRLRF